MFHKEILVWKGNVSSLKLLVFISSYLFYYYQVKISLSLFLLFFPPLNIPHKPVKIALLCKEEKRD